MSSVTHIGQRRQLHDLEKIGRRLEAISDQAKAVVAEHYPPTYGRETGNLTAEGKQELRDMEKNVEREIAELFQKHYDAGTAPSKEELSRMRWSYQTRSRGLGMSAAVTDAAVKERMGRAMQNTLLTLLTPGVGTGNLDIGHFVRNIEGAYLRREAVDSLCTYQHFSQPARGSPSY